MELPANFRIDYTPVPSLPRVDLLVTMSSTACLEAIDHGCRVALVLDLGVHERHGNHVFLESGLLRTFDQMTRTTSGPRRAWSTGGSASGRPPNRTIVDRVEELLDSGDRPSHQIWGNGLLHQHGGLSAHHGDARCFRGRWGRRPVVRDLVPPGLMPAGSGPAGHASEGRTERHT